jgi:hypothetical protein
MIRKLYHDRTKGGYVEVVSVEPENCIDKYLTGKHGYGLHEVSGDPYHETRYKAQQAAAGEPV